MNLVTVEQRFIKIASMLQPWVLLLIRLAWGYELMTTGWGHLHNVDKMVERFTDWGVPFPRPNVYVSGITEMVGGALWMAGFGTRLISIPLVFNFCVAMATAGKENVEALFGRPEWDPTKIVDDSAFPFFAVSLILLAFGPGFVSIDAIIKRLFFKSKNIQIEVPIRNT